MQSCLKLDREGKESIEGHMHEVSIMTEAVRMAAESAQAAGATRITALTLRVGSLSGADAEALRFAWDVVTEETMAAGAQLVIEPVQAVAWCSDCRQEFPLQRYLGECPRCHGVENELRCGRELEIGSVEIE
jgi:hydrogenase nickel incorporation protein HypA/HybF